MTAPTVHNVSTYTNHGCRCEECRAAHATYMVRARADRFARLTADPSAAEHGVDSTYQNWGCRCLACTQANSITKRYQRLRRTRLALASAQLRVERDAAQAEQERSA